VKGGALNIENQSGFGHRLLQSGITHATRSGCG
jgi:hypothetical protein